MGKTYELFNKVAKEVVDVQNLNMNQQEAERYFRHYKHFEDKQDFERLYVTLIFTLTTVYYCLAPDVSHVLLQHF